MAEGPYTSHCALKCDSCPTKNKLIAAINVILKVNHNSPSRKVKKLDSLTVLLYVHVSKLSVYNFRFCKTVVCCC